MPAAVVVAVEVEREAAVAAALDALGLGEDVRGGLGGRAGVGVADLDQRLAEAAGLALVGVADGAVAALHGADDAGGALRGLAALDRPVPAAASVQTPRRGLAQVVGEVLGGARVVRAVHRGDGLVGSVTPGLSAAISGSFQLVILPGKMPATVAGDELQVGDALAGCRRPRSARRRPGPRRRRRRSAAAALVQLVRLEVRRRCRRRRRRRRGTGCGRRRSRPGRS